VIEVTKSKRAEPRIPVRLGGGARLLRWQRASGHPQAPAAKVRADGTLLCANASGSIHQMGAHVQGLDACNGWTSGSSR